MSYVLPPGSVVAGDYASFGTRPQRPGDLTTRRPAAVRGRAAAVHDRIRDGVAVPPKTERTTPHRGLNPLGPTIRSPMFPSLAAVAPLPARRARRHGLRRRRGLSSSSATRLRIARRGVAQAVGPSWMTFDLLGVPGAARYVEFDGGQRHRTSRWPRFARAPGHPRRQRRMKPRRRHRPTAAAMDLHDDGALAQPTNPSTARTRQRAAPTVAVDKGRSRLPLTSSLAAKYRQEIQKTSRLAPRPGLQRRRRRSASSSAGRPRASANRCPPLPRSARRASAAR